MTIAILIPIAILVAAVVLAIFMPTIYVDGYNVPTDKARAMLTELYNKRSTPKETAEVTFGTSTPVLSKDAVTLNTSLSPDQVCFSLGDFAGSEGEWEITPTKLKRNGSLSRNVRLGIECSLGIDALADDVANDFDDATLESGCACTNDDPCCAIVLRRVR